jgi:hypothetical protein
VLNSIGKGVLIGVPGGVTNLIKSISHQVLADRLSHMDGRPWSLASNDCQPQIPDYRLLEIVTAKASCEGLQSGAGRPESLAGRPPMGPTGQWLLHTASSCQAHSWVTLILVEF